MLLKKSFNAKNILVLGFGKSGQSATNLLSCVAKTIFVYDKKFKTTILKTPKKIHEMHDILIKNKCFLLNKKITPAFIKGLCGNYYHKNKLFLNKNNIFFENSLKRILKNKIHFCIVSPGISKYSKEIQAIKNNNIRLISELELGQVFAKGKIFAITGTNGKTTTAHALYNIFKTANKECFLCGNVGTPFTSIANKTTKKSLIVLEVSSFQMETTKTFYPFASAILNITSDHLDRHKTMTNYTHQKQKTLGFYGTKKFLNFDNLPTKRIGQQYYNSKYFSIFNKKISKKNLFLIKNNCLVGNFNYSNLLCASVMAKSVGIKNSTILKANQSFKGLNHRLQKIAQLKNITFINDSKSTNVASTLSALESMTNKTILLIGGADKNLDFSALAKQQVFFIVGYGEIKNKLKTTFAHHTNFLTANNLLDAFFKACKVAKTQTEHISILLSPGATSFDEFKSFEHRGNFFENLVNKYIEIESTKPTNNNQCKT